jgi:hypothetical protein
MRIGVVVIQSMYRAMGTSVPETGVRDACACACDMCMCGC